MSLEPHGDAVVVSIQGELDVVSKQRFEDCLSEAAEQSDRVVLDLSQVDFMDTTALAVIVGHWRRLVAEGGTFRIAGARYRYVKALWITGLADRLPTAPGPVSRASQKPPRASGGGPVTSGTSDRAIRLRRRARRTRSAR
jgi:anti-sigma B factor antagonist